MLKRFATAAGIVLFASTFATAGQDPVRNPPATATQDQPQNQNPPLTQNPPAQTDVNRDQNVVKGTQGTRATKKHAKHRKHHHKTRAAAASSKKY